MDTATCDVCGEARPTKEFTDGSWMVCQSCRALWGALSVLGIRQSKAFMQNWRELYVPIVRLVSARMLTPWEALRMLEPLLPHLDPRYLAEGKGLYSKAMEAPGYRDVTKMRIEVADE